MAARSLRGAVQGLGARQRLRAAARPPLGPAALSGAGWDPRLPPVRCFLNLTTRRKEYSERRIMGYSMQEMYDVVANVEDYKHFVPWCQRSAGAAAARGAPQGALGGRLPARARALHLQRHPGAPAPRQGCLHRWEALQPLGDQLALQPRHRRVPAHQHRGLLGKVSFEFRSLLHSQLATVFFDEVVKQMVAAFERRAGPQLRARDAHPAGADVPRGPSDVRGLRERAPPPPPTPPLFIWALLRRPHPSRPGGAEGPPGAGAGLSFKGF
ncbi:coenzyme Q-binding protein COQ10 homolog A, mitochondrial isoform 2-T2 [Amazona ochrocephala]